MICSKMYPKDSFFKKKLFLKTFDLSVNHYRVTYGLHRKLVGWLDHQRLVVHHVPFVSVPP